MAGATPLLLDIDPDTYTMDADELVAVLEEPPPGLPPIRAAIAVHLYGQACDLAPMLEDVRVRGDRQQLFFFKIAADGPRTKIR